MRDRFRPWIAAVLALLIAGLGHAYLRRWGRALLWFLTILGGAFALTVLYGDPAAETPTDLPSEVLLPVLMLFALSAVDAFLVAREQNREKASRETVAANAGAGGEADVARSGEAATNSDDDDASAGSNGPPDELVSEAEPGETPTVECPHCGKETDADIDFCHWCTEPLPWAENEADDEAQKA